MKKTKKIMIIFISILLAISCAMPDKTPKEETWILVSVKLSILPKATTDTIPGTYIRSNTYSTSHEAVSFYTDGKATSLPFAGKIKGTFSTADVKNGEWAKVDTNKTFALTLNNARYVGDFKWLVDEGEVIGFAIADISGYLEGFIKISDSVFDMSIYDSHRFEGLYVAYDDYGDRYGIEFFKDGKARAYSTKRTVTEFTYKTAPEYCLLKLTDPAGKEQEYNYCIVGDTLFLNGSPLFKVIR